METKKSVVTDIKEKSGSFNGSNGMIYYHTITFQNGDSGQYGSKSETCEKFKAGQEHDYTIETKVNGSYTNYVIKPIQQVGAGTGGGFKQQPKDSSIIAIQSSIASACNFYSNRLQASDEDVIKLASKFYDLVMTKKTI
jgi:hypothetical protein